MISETIVEATGAKNVPMKSTGHEKVRVSVSLAAKLDGTKLKPFIVFRAAKRESKPLHDEYKQQCSVSSSSNAWMNLHSKNVFLLGINSRHILPMKYK